MSTRETIEIFFSIQVGLIHGSGKNGNDSRPKENSTRSMACADTEMFTGWNFKVYYSNLYLYYNINYIYNSNIYFPYSVS